MVDSGRTSINNYLTRQAEAIQAAYLDVRDGKLNVRSSTFAQLTIMVIDKTETSW
jgi:hypothetical protein